MNRLAFEIITLFVLLIGNGVLAMAEIAIVSARQARLRQMADAGHLQAQKALELAATPNEFLATVQIGITLVGILAGAFGGVTLAKEIGLFLERFPPLAPYGESIGIVVVVLVITYFSLILGELVPKRLGLNNAEAIAMRVAGPMQTLSHFAAPLVRLLSFSTDLVLRLLGARASTEPPISPEELKVLVEQGREIGIFEASEQDMIEGVLRLDERRIEAFMVPRTQIVAFDIEDSFEEVRRKILESQHSRFPVIQDNLDNVLGVVHTKDLLNQRLLDEPFDLRTILHSPHFVPESMSALRVLEFFQRARTHMALIADEYGGLQGMVTHNDILEEIAGSIPSTGASSDPAAIHREDGSWLLDGLLDIDELKAIFRLDQMPGEERGRYQTVGGFVMTQVHSVPRAGQSFVWGDLSFEVVDMDGLRVDKVLVSPVQPISD